LFLETAADSAKSDAFRELASQLAGQAASRQSGEYAAQFVVMLAAKPASADALKRAVLEKFSKELKREVVAPWSGELQSAFQRLLAEGDPSVPAAALPLIVRWDKSGGMSGEVKRLVQGLAAQINDGTQPEERRARLIASLLSEREVSRGGLLAGASSLRA